MTSFSNIFSWGARLALIPLFLRARARAARTEKRFRDAALLYEELARLRPDDALLRIQCGHMRKEAGDLPAAEAHYLFAQERLPDDAELALQLGHFYKVKGDLARSETSYRSAMSLRPGWALAEAELAHLHAAGWGAATASRTDARSDADHDSVTADFTRDAESLVDAAEHALLSPGLVPRERASVLHEHAEVVEVRRLGRREPSFWGMAPTLRGVEAIRGFCVSRRPILEMQVILDGLTVHRMALKGGYVLKHELHQQAVKKYVFNAWYDFGSFASGRYKLELRFTDSEHETRSFHDTIVVAEPLSPTDYPSSDGILAISDPDPVALAERIRALPSMVRPARRQLFPDGVHNVLVMRTDQLGDMVASIPAMVRLRELVSDARIVGLLTGANAELAQTLDLFDEIIVVDFPDDDFERRRVMPLETQQALRRQLATYQFDIAVDLASSNVSRELMYLSGAKFTHGIGGGDWPWMTSEVVFNTRDRWSAMDITPHSTKILGIVEALGTVLSDHAPPVTRRKDLTRGVLAEFGLGGDERYVLLHAGARVRFSRWPHYAKLARLLLDRTDLHIVMISEDAGVRETLPDDLLVADRFQFLGRRLPFAVFDAFVSFATVMVGNDSGPKHLASLRGTNVVTLFTARVSWAEWGQENIGSIISRRVPCQGCAIFHDAEECGQDFTCIADIRPQEVFDTIMQYASDAPATNGVSTC